jgi:hypothetical protein
MIIIGSRALLFRLLQTEEVTRRLDKADYDVIMSFDEYVNWHDTYRDYIKSAHLTNENKFKVVVIKDDVRKVYEIEIAFDIQSQSTSVELLMHYKNKPQVTDATVEGFFGESYRALTLEYQALTKRSHLIYPVHFEKNMSDYQLFKRLLGDFERDELMQQYYTLRFNEAKERYNQRTPNLNVTTEDFFSSKLAVPNYFVHDDIHEAMAHHDRPIFTMMQPDPSKAWCSKEMFFNLPFEYQVQCVQEEAYVIALERYIIPQYGNDWEDYFESYKKAVKRICTTLTSGWFRSFAIENYQAVIANYNPDFVEIFKTKVEQGKVRPIRDDVPKMIA